MPCWFPIFVNAFCNEASLKVWKRKSLLIDLSKFSKIMHHYVFFLELCELCAWSEQNYAILHPWIIPAALMRPKYHFVSLHFSFVVLGENGSTHFASYQTRTAPYKARLCINMTAISAAMAELREHLVKYINITFWDEMGKTELHVSSDLSE